MNKFFISKVSKIRNGISFLPNDFKKCKDIMQGKNLKLSFTHVTVNKINKILKSLKNTRSTSMDGLDNYVIKLAADVIEIPVHHIITLSLLQSRFPACWKFSKLIPLYKKDSNIECKNYRPVSIFSTLSKVLERVVYEELYDYFSRN